MQPETFRPLAHFEPPRSGYDLLPFRFLKWESDEYLLVNDVGEFLFADRQTLSSLAAGSLHPHDPLYKSLKAKHFLSDGDTSVALDLLATKYRTKKSFLEGFTSLHLFVVTLRCDHSCQYCQVSRVSQDRGRYDMSRDTATKAIELMFRSPSRSLTVEFQGGEPLLRFDIIQFVVEQVLARNVKEGRSIRFVVATTLAMLDAQMLSFFREHAVLLSTSLDGPEGLHNANRPRPGRDSYRIFREKLEMAREWLGTDQISALMTTTAASLRFPREIVNEYAQLRFSTIFLRAVSPYGFAVRSRSSQLYDTEEFLSFYRIALDRIIELNRAGVPLVEVYSQILLTNMLTPFPPRYVDLQSPAGAGIGAVAYNYDGQVYVSDEARMLAEMGDFEFSLGNVHNTSYEELFSGPKLRSLTAGSVIEALPGCSECAFLPYCGSDPLFHYRTQGDPIGHRPTSAFCRKNMAILRHLFGLLRGGDSFVERLFTQWATGIPCVEKGEGPA